MAMFSMCIFKPIVEPFCLFPGKLIRKILYFGGKPFEWIDRKIAKLAGIEARGSGIAVLMFTMLTLMISAVILSKTYTGLCSLYMQDHSLLYLALWVILNTVAVLVTGIYTRAKHGNYFKYKERCKVEWYSFTIFIVSLLALIAISPSMILGAVIAVGLGLKVFAIGIGSSLWWVLINGFLLIMAVIGFLLKCIISKYMGMLVIAVVVFALTGKLFLWLEDKYCNYSKKQLNTHKTTQSDWIYFFASYLASNNAKYVPLFHQDVLWAIDRFLFDNTLEDYINRSNYNYVHNVTFAIEEVLVCAIRNGVLVFPKELLDIPNATFQHIKHESFKSLKEQKGEIWVFQLIFDTISELTKEFPALEKIRKFRADMMDVFCAKRCAAIQPIFNESTEYKAESYKRIIQCLNEYDEKRKQKVLQSQKREQLCKQISTPVASFWTNLTGAMRLLIWEKMIRRLLRGIWFVLRQFGTFLVYMWVVIKHLKHGACPYRVFMSVEEAEALRNKDNQK
ncbi:MAG: hypothetical protein PHW03_02720 [Eubacteriales bacterium]|nr:hypothetical protein [Eubacteriales bacterium]